MTLLLLLLFSSLLSLTSATTFLDYDRQYLWDTLSSGGLVGPGNGSSFNYCGLEAVQQTPINIDPRLVHRCPTQYGDLEWLFGTGQIVSWTVTNTGKELLFEPTTLGSSQAAVLFNNFITTLGRHQYYCLEQFHIHFGINSDRGSEHSFNGEFYPLEMHFVHFGCEYGTIGQAATSAIPPGQDPNKFGVVGIFFEESATDNPFWAEVLKPANLAILRTAGNSVTINAHLLNLDDIVPNLGPNGVVMENRGPYYLYDGGLTTPPCTPIVQWHVLQTRMPMSAGQLASLRTLLNDDPAGPEPMAPTYRNLQPNLAKTTLSLCPNPRPLTALTARRR